MEIDKTLNMLLVTLFQDIMDIEEKALITEEFRDISNNDMHIIEAIGPGKPKTSSTVARAMSVTMGTLTKAIDGLSEKEYVKRERSTEDKRVVLLSLLPKGIKAFRHHEKFHRDMIDAVIAQLDEEETQILKKSLGSLVGYLKEGGPMDTKHPEE